MEIIKKQKRFRCRHGDDLDLRVPKDFRGFTRFSNDSRQKSSNSTIRKSFPEAAMTENKIKLIGRLKTNLLIKRISVRRIDTGSFKLKVALKIT